MNKDCQNYGTSWCADFECEECPVKNTNPKPKPKAMTDSLTEKVADIIMAASEIWEVYLLTDKKPQGMPTYTDVADQILAIINKPVDKLSPYSLPSDAYDKYFTPPIDLAPNEMLAVVEKESELPGIKPDEPRDSEYNYKYFAFGDVCKDAQQDILDDKWRKVLRIIGGKG